MAKKKQSKKTTTHKNLIILLACIAVFFLANITVSNTDPATETKPNKIESVDSLGCDSKVLGIGVYGVLTTYPREIVDESGHVTTSTSSDDVIYALESGAKDPDIEAIVIEFDSPGGLPVAGEEIANAIKRINKTTISLIRNQGNSAAYWAASAADTVFALKNSDVGSIGVTASYLDNSKHNEKEGLTYQQLTSAPYKDIGSPDKPLTEEERFFIERDLEIIHQNFVEAIASHRNLDYNLVSNLANGSSMLGDMAKQYGLIDRVGDIYTVKDYLINELYLTPDESNDIDICWF